MENVPWQCQNNNRGAADKTSTEKKDLKPGNEERKLSPEPSDCGCDLLRKQFTGKR